MTARPLSVALFVVPALAAAQAARPALEPVRAAVGPATCAPLPPRMRDDPDAAWSDQRAAKQQARAARVHGVDAGLGALEDTTFAAGDVEARLWYFGGSIPDAVVLRRAGARWHVARVGVPSAMVVLDCGRGFHIQLNFAVTPVALPDSAAAALWARLEAGGLDTLADEPARVPPNLTVVDGESYVVEVRRGPAYRIAAFPWVDLRAASGTRARALLIDARRTLARPAARRRPPPGVTRRP